MPFPSSLLFHVEASNRTAEQSMRLRVLLPSSMPLTVHLCALLLILSSSTSCLGTQYQDCHSYTSTHCGNVGIGYPFGKIGSGCGPPLLNIGGNEYRILVLPSLANNDMHSMTIVNNLFWASGSLCLSGNFIQWHDSFFHMTTGYTIVMFWKDFFQIPKDPGLPMVTSNACDDPWYNTLASIKRLGRSENDLNYWFSAMDLGLAKEWAQEWNVYVSRLNFVGILLTSSVDEIVWTGNPSNVQVTTKLAYKFFADFDNFQVPKWWFGKLWKWKIPQKLTCFLWLVLENNILTWDNIFHRGWVGPNRCAVCENDEESIHHIFKLCHLSVNLWKLVCDALSINIAWGVGSFDSNLHAWYKNEKVHKFILAYMIWGIWRLRNAAIF